MSMRLVLECGKNGVMLYQIRNRESKLLGALGNSKGILHQAKSGQSANLTAEVRPQGCSNWQGRGLANMHAAWAAAKAGPEQDNEGRLSSLSLHTSVFLLS
ncbi:hypothetical protein HYC85_020221 [Camellia sinensis]|uniref:Uncharacterized protein n=1 Tax=Camellia sinensis TaxID=4442 RepID=A0A7J7GP52_CAMSI|nr:hypothetical protein HYC85_020221 [Camellia sinensis]